MNPYQTIIIYRDLSIDLLTSNSDFETIKKWHELKTSKRKIKAVYFIKSETTINDLLKWKSAGCRKNSVFIKHLLFKGMNHGNS